MRGHGAGSGSALVKVIGIRCPFPDAQVVPVLDRVLITMSPSRKGKPSQRALSSSSDRYRTSSAATRRAYEPPVQPRPHRGRTRHTQPDGD